MLDRTSPVPLYFQLSQQLEQAIASGALQPGDRIDTEVELSRRYGLSRPTVHQAIQELVSKGLLVRRRGVGTQVVHTHLRRQVQLTSLYDDLASSNHLPRTRVLHLAHEPADAKVATALNIEAGSSVLVLERLRLDGEAPLAIMHNWLPGGLIDPSAADLEGTGLYDLLRRSGVHLRVANQRIGAAAATSPQARLLDLKSGAPLLTMERTAFDVSGRAVEYATHVYRADGHSFETTLVVR